MQHINPCPMKSTMRKTITQIYSLTKKDHKKTCHIHTQKKKKSQKLKREHWVSLEKGCLQTQLTSTVSKHPHHNCTKRFYIINLLNLNKQTIYQAQTSACTKSHTLNLTKFGVISDPSQSKTTMKITKHYTTSKMRSWWDIKQKTENVIFTKRNN